MQKKTVAEEFVIQNLWTEFKIEHDKYELQTLFFASWLVILFRKYDDNQNTDLRLFYI